MVHLSSKGRAVITAPRFERQRLVPGHALHLVGYVGIFVPLPRSNAYDETVYAREQQKQKLRLHKRLGKQAKYLGLQLVLVTA